MDEKPFKSRLYGRKQTRALGWERQDVMNAIYPRLSIPLTVGARETHLNPQSLFPKPQPIWFEIGFGCGEHVAELMRRHPELNFIGAEPFINGMSALMKHIKDDPQDNIRVWMDDAMPLARAFMPDSIEGIYILNPDPWPKKRHYKRRIITPENLDIFARILRPGGTLIMATDIDELADWMFDNAAAHGAFEWTGADKRAMPHDWVETRYQQKGAGKGRSQSYLIFRKNF